MIVVTAAQMREMDRLTIEKYGVPSLTLMERAGQEVARSLVERFAERAGQGVLIVAGKGNNGGDGLVVARWLRQRGIPCEVALLAGRAEVSPDAAVNLAAYLEDGGRITEVAPDGLNLLETALSGKGLAVDAILGTGMKSEVRGLYANAIELLNASGLPIVAVDIPSGLHSDTGAPLGTCIRARMTVALGFAKLGAVIHPGLSHAGELVVADIGIRPEAVTEAGADTEISTADEMRRLMPRREPDSHKGTYGHVLVMAGSRGKTGAAILAARAAMRAGAGLATLAAARSLNDIFAGALVEVMTEPLPDNDAAEVEALLDDEWRRLLQRKSVMLFGPGIGVGDASRSNLRWLLRRLDLPWVIDADGLNNLALDLERLRRAKTPPILTPHPGEMARLTGKSTREVNGDRIGVARGFAGQHRCYVVLKGARTVMALPDGRVFINPTGNPGMASAGMGDVLAGILAALLAQGLAPADAMKLGVYLHGLAGDRVAGQRGGIGMIASDLIAELPAAARSLAGAA